MKHYRRNVLPVNKPNADYEERSTQFVFNNETQQIYRELKNEIESLKLENKINKQISRILEQRLIKFKE